MQSPGQVDTWVVRRSENLIPLVLGPVASVATLWLFLYLDRRDVAPTTMVFASLPAIAGVVWATRRHPTVGRALTLTVGAVAVTVALAFASIMVGLLVASLSCPPDAYECPI